MPTSIPKNSFLDNLSPAPKVEKEVECDHPHFDYLSTFRPFYKKPNVTVAPIKKDKIDSNMPLLETLKSYKKEISSFVIFNKSLELGEFDDVIIQNNKPAPRFKLIQFSQDYKPAYFGMDNFWFLGTFRLRNSQINSRTPFKKSSTKSFFIDPSKKDAKEVDIIQYEVDSDVEWINYEEENCESIGSLDSDRENEDNIDLDDSDKVYYIFEFYRNG